MKIGYVTRKYFSLIKLRESIFNTDTIGYINPKTRIIKIFTMKNKFEEVDAKILDICNINKPILGIAKQ